jgi:hypothetical protein
MSNYQLASQDEHKYHVLHPDGSTFHIAKHGIDAQLAKRIEGMPKAKGYAQGGLVEPDVTDPGAPMPDNAYAGSPAVDDALNRSPAMSSEMAQSMGNAYGQAYGIDPTIKPDQPIPVPTDPQGAAYATAYNTDLESKMKGNKPASTMNSAPTGPTVQEQNATKGSIFPSQAPTSSTPANPFGDPTALYKSALQQTQSGVLGEAGAHAEGLKQQAQVYQDSVAQQQKITQEYDVKRKALDDEHKQLFDSVVNGKVDPKHYFGSMSTGNKVLAGISVILSGIGSGMSHQPNLAIQTFDKAIDRDIDAQKAELGKKSTLLSDNLRRYGDLNQAEAATRLQLNTVTQAQIAAVAAKSGSKEVQGQSACGAGSDEDPASPDGPANGASASAGETAWSRWPTRWHSGGSRADGDAQ